MGINKNLAVVFPGQGSQSVGMLNDLWQTFPEVATLLTTASNILGYDLSGLIQNGPEEELNQTEKTQPALLTAGVAVWEIYKKHTGIIPAFFAGHSLGEYTALVCANVISFEEGIRLVSERGRCMQNAVPPGGGAMAAILGLNGDIIADICKKYSGEEVVSISNFNSPGQTVIAGHKSAVEHAVEGCRQAGAKRAVVLAVSIPSHCELMKKAAQEFAKSLDSVPVSDSDVPIIQNVDGIARNKGADIKPMLLKQLYCPVRWTDSIAFLVRNGISTIVECGPGRVLCGLVKQIDRSLQALPTMDSASLEQAMDTVKKSGQQ